MPSDPKDPQRARQVVIYRVAGRRFALPLAAVEYVVRAVAITPLPGAPECVAGVIDVHGDILPVIDCRRCFGLAVRALDPADRLIIGRVGSRTVALWVDEVEGVHECEVEEIVPADEFLPGAHTQGVLKLPDGNIAPLQELDSCLTPEHAKQLDLAMETS